MLNTLETTHYGCVGQIGTDHAHVLYFCEGQVNEREAERETEGEGG